MATGRQSPIAAGGRTRGSASHAPLQLACRIQLLGRPAGRVSLSAQLVSSAGRCCVLLLTLANADRLPILLQLYDRVYYGDVLPPIGSYQLSYARWEGSLVSWKGRASCGQQAAAAWAAAACWAGSAWG